VRDVVSCDWGILCAWVCTSMTVCVCVCVCVWWCVHDAFVSMCVSVYVCSWICPCVLCVFMNLSICVVCVYVCLVCECVYMCTRACVYIRLSCMAGVLICHGNSVVLRTRCFVWGRGKNVWSLLHIFCELLEYNYITSSVTSRRQYGVPFVSFRTEAGPKVKN